MSRIDGIRVVSCGLVAVLVLSAASRAEIVAYHFTQGVVNQDLGSVYAPGTPVSGALAYVTGAPPTQQLSSGRTIYISSAAHPFYASLTIGPDTFEFFDESQGRMLVQNWTGDRLEFRATDQGNLNRSIEFEITDFQGTVFSSQDMPPSIDFAQIDQPLSFTFTRPVNSVVKQVLGVINPLSFSATPPPTGLFPGDMNCDGVINNFDIDPFVLAIVSPSGYLAAYPNCNINNADTNGDSMVNNFDIDTFIQCVTVGCP